MRYVYVDKGERQLYLKGIVMHLRGRSSSGSSRSWGGGISVGGGFVILRGVDGNFDCDLPSADVFALEGFDSLLLLVLGANVNEAVALAPPGCTPASADNTSRFDLDTSVGEEGRETSVINVEPKVGDKENSLGEFASGVLASRTSGTGSLGLTSTRLLFSSHGAFSSGGVRSSSFTFGLCLGFALKVRG